MQIPRQIGLVEGGLVDEVVVSEQKTQHGVPSRASFRTRLDPGAQLAKQLGVSRQTILSIERGKYDPSLLLAFKISRAFGLAKTTPES